jgi:hypothetical protein
MGLILAVIGVQMLRAGIGGAVYVRITPVAELKGTQP